MTVSKVLWKTYIFTINDFKIHVTNDNRKKWKVVTAGTVLNNNSKMFPAEVSHDFRGDAFSLLWEEITPTLNKESEERNNNPQPTDQLVKTKQNKKI